MKKILFLLVLTIVGYSKLNAQVKSNAKTTNTVMNTIYVEAFGQGFAGSLNYDRMFKLDKRWKNSFTVGAVFVPKSLKFGDGMYIGLPASYNWLIGGKRNFLELGIGLTTQFVDSYNTYENLPNQKDYFFYTYFTPKIGYRFQAVESGIFFRATITPHVALVNSSLQVRDQNIIASSELFTNVLNLDYPAFPWVGMSIGYTFRSKGK